MTGETQPPGSWALPLDLSAALAVWMARLEKASAARFTPPWSTRHLVERRRGCVAWSRPQRPSEKSSRRRGACISRGVSRSRQGEGQPRAFLAVWWTIDRECAGELTIARCWLVGSVAVLPERLARVGPVAWNRDVVPLVARLGCRLDGEAPVRFSFLSGRADSQLALDKMEKWRQRKEALPEFEQVRFETVGSRAGGRRSGTCCAASVLWLVFDDSAPRREERLASVRRYRRGSFALWRQSRSVGTFRHPRRETCSSFTLVRVPIPCSSLSGREPLLHSKV